MKKLKLLTLFLVLSLSCALFAGCGNGLPTPQDVYVDVDWELYWGAVERVSGYTIEVTSDDTGEVLTYNTRRTHISLEELEEGDYSVKIKALSPKGESKDSAWSDPYPFHKDYENGCMYKLTVDGLSYYLARAGSAQGDIIITDEYRGKPVVGIGQGAFKGNNKVTSIKITGNITYIDAMAFYNNTVLESIEIPESVTFIGSDAFTGCSALETVNIPESITEISPNLFMFCKSLKTLPIHDKIEYIGAGAFKDCVGLEEITIPNSVVYIDGSAFDNCTGVKKLTIGEGVTYIGSSAFRRLSALEEVVFSNEQALTEIDSYAFADCDKLQSITVPEGVQTIGSYAFADCSLLGEVNLPETVTSLGTSIVYLSKIYEDAKLSGSPFVYVGNWITGCYLDGTVNSPQLTLTEVTSANVKEGTVGIAARSFLEFEVLYKVVLPDSIKYVGDYVFANCEKLQQFKVNDTSKLENVGYYCFAGSKKLKVVNLGQNITRINGYAFLQCESIVTNELGVRFIPESVTSVGTYAFYETGIWNEVAEGEIVYVDNWIVGHKGVSGAAKIKEFEGDIGIADYAFYNNTDLINIDISKARYIGEYAFSGCEALASVSFNRNLREIKNGTFYKCKALHNVIMPPRLKSIGDYAFYACPTISEVNLSSSTVETIGAFAFGGGVNIKSVDLGTYLTDIGDYAFYGCSSLFSIDIPATVDKINGRTFAYCERLSRVTLNEGIKSIGDYAFNGCQLLNNVVLPSTVKTLGRGAFYGCRSLSSIFLNEGLESIGDYCFTTDANLENIKIPSTVTHIGTGSYIYSSMPSFVLSDNVEYVGEHVFFGNPDMTVYTSYTTLEDIAEKLWNTSFSAVVYGCKLSDAGDYVVSVTVTKDSIKVYYDGTTLGDPTREGYVFKGWGNAPENPTAVYTSDVLLSLREGTTVYAVWEEVIEEEQP